MNNSNMTTPKPQFTPKATRLWVLLAMVVGAASQSTQAPASFDVDGLMKDMYSNTTSGGYFKTQQRGVFATGSYVGRVPIKPVNLFAIDPPRMSAGCGGVNMFGGSFSFINSQEIQALLRAVAQNAVGLLFHIAVNAISQPLSSLMNTWSKKLQDMNSTLRNSCEIARKIFQFDNNGEGSFRQMKNELTNMLTDKGAWVDAFKGYSVTGALSTGWDQLRGKAANDPATKTLPSVGNLVMNALNQTDVPKALAQQNSYQEEDVKLLLMSLTGTQVNDPTKQYNADSCPANNTECTSNPSSQSGKPKIIAPTLTFRALISPEPADMMLVCADGSQEGSCLDVKTVGMNTRYKGILSKINKVMFDIDQPTRVSEYVIKQQIIAGKGLVGKARIANATATTEEESLLGMTEIQLVKLIAQNPPDQGAHIAAIAAETIAHEQAKALADALVATARRIYTGSVQADKPQDFDKNIEYFERQTHNAYQDMQAKHMNMSQMNAYLTTLSNTAINLNQIPANR